MVVVVVRVLIAPTSSLCKLKVKLFAHVKEARVTYAIDLVKEKDTDFLF